MCDKGPLGLRLELPGPFLKGALFCQGHEGKALDGVRLSDSCHVLGQRACVVEHAAVAPETAQGHREVLGVGVLDVHVHSVGHEGGPHARPGLWDRRELETNPHLRLQDTNVFPVC